MKLDKITIALGLIIATAYSCEKRIDHYGSENTGPSVQISARHNVWNDTEDYLNIIIDSLKNENRYIISFNQNDNLGQAQLKISKPEFGKILHNSVEITYDSFIDVNHNFDTYTYESDSLGNETIEFIVKDPYDLESSAVLYLNVFKNLLPKVNFQMTSLNNLNALEYMIDASSSFDRDGKFGGKLINFQYVVDNDTTYHPSDQMNYIFPEVKDYVISVKAMDSDSVWSGYKTIGNFMP